jgi:hypothetical protein
MDVKMLFILASPALIYISETAPSASSRMDNQRQEDVSLNNPIEEAGKKE